LLQPLYLMIALLRLVFWLLCLGPLLMSPVLF
jgi:hypothetical protein